MEIEGGRLDNRWPQALVAGDGDDMGRGRVGCWRDGQRFGIRQRDVAVAGESLGLVRRATAED